MPREPLIPVVIAWPQWKWPGEPRRESRAKIFNRFLIKNSFRSTFCGLSDLRVAKGDGHEARGALDFFVPMCRRMRTFPVGLPWPSHAACVSLATQTSV